ncbi:hypothetical protein Poly51_49040 [Rubripirellula tenax]|uniref:Uncharacterized protein n=1 Tax=Rubripirellula tenax TaxID=2528015 RepID=A0A5C6EKJ5_9BACT|nr:hypothetical protein Poly51_49040 [Rubripirellula tenax]
MHRSGGRLFSRSHVVPRHPVMANVTRLNHDCTNAPKNRNHVHCVMTRMLEALRGVALFVSGWVVLAILGIAFASAPLLALTGVSVVGFACAIKGFGSLEMPFAMVVSAVLGAVLLPKTEWAWIAPWLPGGFMVSVVLTDLFDKEQ